MIEYMVKVYEDRTEWWLNDKRHRVNDKRHRVNGPAIEWANGDKEWYLNGKLHREDGPAIEWADGGKAWYLNGKELTEEEWKKRVSSAKELSVEEISRLLGYEVKIVKIIKS